MEDNGNLWEYLLANCIASLHFGLCVYWKALKDYGYLWVCLAICILSLYLKLCIYWVVLRNGGNLWACLLAICIATPIFISIVYLLGGG